MFKNYDSINEELQEIILQINENNIELIDNDLFLNWKVSFPSNIIKEVDF